MKALHELIRIKVPTLVFLIEIKLNYREVEKLKGRLGFNSGLIVSCEGEINGRYGGLYLFLDG